MAFSRRRRVRPVALDPATGDVLAPGPFIGLGLLVCSFFLYAASPLLAPWWAVVVLLMTWLAMLVLCFRWWKPHPARLVPLGVFSFVWWFLAVVGGGILFDWAG